MCAPRGVAVPWTNLGACHRRLKKRKKRKKLINEFPRSIRAAFGVRCARRFFFRVEWLRERGRTGPSSFRCRDDGCWDGAGSRGGILSAADQRDMSVFGGEDRILLEEIVETTEEQETNLCG